MVWVMPDMGTHAATKEIFIAVYLEKLPFCSIIVSAQTIGLREKMVLDEFYSLFFVLDSLYHAFGDFFVMIFNFSTSISVSVLISSLG